MHLKTESWIQQDPFSILSKQQNVVKNKISEALEREEVEEAPSMLSKTEKGESMSTKLRLFLPHASSTSGVRSTITTGVISCFNIFPNTVPAGSIISVSLWLHGQSID